MGETAGIVLSHKYVEQLAIEALRDLFDVELADEANMMVEPIEEVEKLIELRHGKMRMLAALVGGIAEAESGLRVYASRYEPGYKYLDNPSVWANKFKPYGLSIDTEKYGQRVSFGLMQIMGATARWMGFDEPFLTELFVPKTNVYYACKYIRWLYLKARERTKDLPDEDIVIYITSMYNAGPGAKINKDSRTGNIIVQNPRHVGRVLAKYTEWKVRLGVDVERIRRFAT